MLFPKLRFMTSFRCAEYFLVLCGRNIYASALLMQTTVHLRAVKIWLFSIIEISCAPSNPRTSVLLALKQQKHPPTSLALDQKFQQVFIRRCTDLR